MTGAELISYVRNLLVDTNKPYLFSNELILRFLNEAQNKFCELTHVLIKDDITIDLEYDVNVYTLPSYVLRVYAASIDGVLLSMLTTPGVHIMYAKPHGEPRTFSTSLGAKKLVLYPKPDKSYVLTLVSAVLPVASIELDSEPEIPAVFHDVLCDYAAYKSISIPDMDGYNPETAMMFEKRWHEGVRNAKRNTYLERAPMRVDMPMYIGG